MTAEVAIPSKSDLLYPVLEAVRRLGGTAPVAKIEAAVVAAEGFSEEQLSVAKPNNRSTILSRMAWARTDLKRAGLLDNLDKGVWSVTPLGGRAPRPDVFDLTGTVVAKRPPESSDDVVSETVPPSGFVPNADDRAEALKRGLADWHQRVSNGLLEQVLEAPPDRLERIILDLLEAMGYTSRGGKVERLGGAGDGGVDGVVIDDPLGIRRLYCQAKRYALHRQVGPHDIREFIGALDIKSRQEGVFVSTSDFTAQARETAERSSKHIRLINGTELTELMVKHGIGTTVHNFTVHEIDPGYFG